MQVLDYGRSFVTFTTPGRGNNARLQIESITSITDARTQQTQDYYFYASCKSEDTFAKKDLFHADNYDFCGIFSTDQYAIFRTQATHHAAFREEGLWRDRFEDVSWHLRYAQARALETSEQIVDASLVGDLLIGRVEWVEGPLSIRLEFPIKTMNANDEHMLWQVDTGPLAFPAGAGDGDLLIAHLSPAYVAYNAAHFADFVVQAPMEVGGTEITHYGKCVTVPSQTHVLNIG
ncbi:MAG: hypothetical protein ACI906_004794 [Candidatus Latescibacterota bacterium]|jgi:hypothetical protein